MTVYEMNIFQTLCFMYLCKNGNTPKAVAQTCSVKKVFLEISQNS